MCGIVGLLNYKHDIQSNIEKMKNRMIHRGPDSEGTYVSEDGLVALGHRRLAIMDITPTGAQPMKSHDGRYIMVFNGEIYNHLAVKKKLIEEGYCKEADFVGTSDSEILLEAVCAYGMNKTLELIKGMFGIAIYDLKENCLYLSRDRIGEKPLYYGRVEDAFVFASDIGSIAAIDGFDNPVNEEVLSLYFTLGYIPAPYSIYKDIHKLEPGCVLKLEAPFTTDAKMEISAYWSIVDVAQRGRQNRFTGTFEEATDELERLLKESIKGQMVADVPVGAFLSAGIDSSTCVALMQSLNTTKVRSFTIGMDDPKYNEATFAKEIAAHLGTEHTELYITEDDAKKVIPNLSHMFGEPFADSSQIPTYLVSKMTREHVTVSLSGDGGDELFCGYTTYNNVDRIWNNMKSVPYWVRKPISGIAGGITSAIAGKVSIPGGEAIRIKSALLGAKGPEDLYNVSRKINAGIGQVQICNNALKSVNETDGHDVLGENNRDLMLMDMRMYHPDDILVKVDRTAMAVSLETRVPMLDKDVVEFAWTLPIEYLRDGNTGKRILREVLYRYVPKEMMERPKKGFSIPIERWIREDKDLRAWAETLLDRDLIKSQGYLNADVVWHMWKNFTEKGQWHNMLWNILMFQEWLVNERLGM